MATAPSIIPDPAGISPRPAIRLTSRNSTQDLFIKRIRNNAITREVDCLRWRHCYCLMGAAAAVFVLVFLLAFQHFECVHYGYQIEQLRAERHVLNEQNQVLRLEQASLASPERIDTLAREELDLAPATPGQVIRLHTNSAPPSPRTREVARIFTALTATSRGLPREP